MIRDPAIQPANPAPLGLAAFGVTTIVLSAINAGVLGENALPAVLPLAFAFGGITQLLVGVMEYRNGNTFGTVAFSAYGAFWLWFPLIYWASGAGWMQAPSSAGMGFTLMMWGVFSLYMWVSTFRINLSLWSVFLFLWIALFLLAAGEFGLPTKALGGWVGIVTGLDALYVSFAEVTNATFGHTVLPLGSPLSGATPPPEQVFRSKLG